MEQGVMAAINNVIDYEVAANVAEKWVLWLSNRSNGEKNRQQPHLMKKAGWLLSVVTILGHVDHQNDTVGRHQNAWSSRSRRHRSISAPIR